MFLKCFEKKLYISIPILIVFAFFLHGCGKKAPPVYPRQEPPLPVTDLSKSIDSDKLKLIWTAGKRKNVKSKPVGFIVYRSKNMLLDSDCKNCPVVFTRVADISVQMKDLKKTLTYEETLEKGYRYVYKVNAYFANRVVSGDSNLLSFTY